MLAPEHLGGNVLAQKLPKNLTDYFIFVLQLALQEMQNCKDAEAEIAQLKKKHYKLEQAWEAGKEKSAKLKQQLIDNRRMS